MRTRIFVAAAIALSAVPAHGQEAAHRAPIKEGAVFPVTKESTKKLYSLWGQKGLDRINRATQAAVDKASRSPRCDAVSISGYSFGRSDPPKHFSVFAGCLNGEQFFFTEEEALGTSEAPTSLQEELATISDSDAMLACKRVAQPKVRFGSTMDVSVLNTNVHRGAQGISVALSFKAKNGFGALLPYVAHCVVDTSGAQLLSIKED